MTVRELIVELTQYPMDAQVKIFHPLAYDININCNPILPESYYDTHCIRIDIDFPNQDFVIRRRTEEDKEDI